MCFTHKKTQSNECLICFEPLLKKACLPYLIHPLPICYDCYKKLENVDSTVTFHGRNLTILYKYNDFFRSLLYQYKGLYDYALKDVFLCEYKDYLNKKYKGYIIVVAPSSDEDNQVREFAPVKTIASTLDNAIFDGLYKTKKYKQSNARYEDRAKIQEVIMIKDPQKLHHKKVLLLDDVMTSSSTIKRCLSLIEQANPTCIDILVLSSSHEIETYADKK